MKKTILLALLLCISAAKAQITLEHTYDTASVSSAAFIPAQLMIVDFEASGQRYVKINRDQKQIQIYTMGHALTKVISYSAFPQACNNLPYVLYLSERLFDPDPDIEFMYIATNCSGTTSTYIYKENGTLLFSAVAAPLIMSTIELQQYPIYNTNQGTKMILSFSDGTAKVYSLPGVLPCTSPCNSSAATGIHNGGILPPGNMISNPYPNPASTATTIDYSLPENINEGEIVFYDLQGKEIKRFKVDRTFSSLVVSTSDIAAGSYYYQLQVKGNASTSKKLIVIK
ncbi:MAG: hypothetical protein JWO09_1513 [Bacteroidetes bacterium]|nr:hypothetical protein [Bacteroidota bacterium]